MQKAPTAKPPVQVNQNLNQAVPANLNENLNLANENLNANLNMNVNENVNANLNQNENQNANLNMNANANLNLPPAPIAINYTSTLDSDRDNLTDVEEDLYGTDKRKPDTDNDGYIDGDEMINLYDPKQAGGALLENSGLVNIYTNPNFNYRVFYPSSWLARPTDSSSAEVIFQSATSEFIEVSALENPDKLDLVQWFLTQSPNTDLNQIKRLTTKQGYDGLISPDQLTYYLMDKNYSEKVYAITYNINELTKVNFLTTFKMMVSSFELTLQLPQINTNTNTNTNLNTNTNTNAPAFPM